MPSAAVFEADEQSQVVNAHARVGRELLERSLVGDVVELTRRREQWEAAFGWGGMGDVFLLGS